MCGFLCASCSPRGASRSSRNVDAGCDGRFKSRLTSANERMAKSCGPGPPLLGSSSLVMIGGRRWLTSRHTGESTYKPYTIAQGMPDCFGVPVVSNSCAYLLHTRLRVCQTPGIPCALSLEGDRYSKARADRAARRICCVGVPRRASLNDVRDSPRQMRFPANQATVPPRGQHLLLLSGHGGLDDYGASRPL